MITFPDRFYWGTSTSAYQIEGAVNEDGRGVSIWDTFCRTSGKIYHNENGDVAADHYHHWAEDVDIMASLGINAYRFSVSWPRILPEGRGKVNTAGLDFYDRLVDALLANHITPFPTLYHWDLPQPLQDAGGWPERATAEAFAEYAAVLGRRLGDRVPCWITHNEPMVAAYAGHLLGENAPGVQDIFATFSTVVHLLLSHGLAVQALRSVVRPDAKIGIALNLSPIHPASDSPEDRQAADIYDLGANRIFLEPVLYGRLPAGMEALPLPLDMISAADLQTMGERIDFLGVNYYTRAVVQHDPEAFPLNAKQIQPEGSEYSQMWEIYPPGIGELLERIWNEAKTARPDLRLMVTENGVCVADAVDFDGRVRDTRRIAYLRDHIGEVWKAMQKGVPVDGYFVWSLLDNFEWNLGYQMRFGLVHINFDTLKRTIKDSGRWFGGVARRNGLED
ncbi:MAG TPA: GH1 family beta-glucosidase [Anaerolineaceae bacterium]|nr:GH1 family beta-glucosidase [Anaerolineaceae bacterium]HPN52081.1 GH1 family beta-glucosidase [Anaerolineaceae bacterium]